MSDMKLIGKLGLNLTQLQKDIKTMESLINDADKHAKKLGDSWSKAVNKMNKAFKNYPINDFTKTLAKFEQTQTKSLQKMAKDKDRFRLAEQRKDQKHQNRMLIDMMKARAQIQRSEEKHQLSLSRMRERYQRQDLFDRRKHFQSLERLESQYQNPLGRRTNSLIDYAVASTAIYGAIRAFKEVIKVNKEFEKEQVNLKRVLKATQDEMMMLKDITFDIAKATGNVTKDIQAIENLWIRTGRQSLDELKELTEITSIGLNTAQFKDAGESVAFLNGAINQMANGDWTKAKEILDSWAKTADNTAVKATEDLAQVISRTGSQAKQLDLTFHDLNAITSILAERMAIDGKKIGTSMKTIFARISDPSKYKVLKEYGVDVFKEGTKEMKGFVDIMNELTAKYKEFSEAGNDQAINNMFKALGGTRRRDIISNLIDGWDTYEEKVKISLDSTGYAMEQNKKIMETFDKQVEVLKVTLAELALTIGESGLMPAMEGLVTGTSGAVNWFNELNPHVRNTVVVIVELLVAFGALNIALKKFGKVSILEGIFGAIQKYTSTIDISKNTKAFEYLNSTLKEGILTNRQMGKVVMYLNGNLRVSQLTTQELTVARNAQTLATYTATNATKVLNIAVSASLIIIPILIGTIMTWKQSQEELKRKTLESIKTQREEIETVEDLIGEYENLTAKSKILGGATKLTADERKKLTEIEERFAEIYPKTVEGINAQNNAYTTQLGLVKQLTEEKKKALLQETEVFILANQSEYERAQKKIKSYTQKFDTAEEYLTYSSKGVEYKPSEEKIAEYRQKLLNKIQDETEFVEEYQNKLQLLDELKNALSGGSNKKQLDSKSNIPVNSQVNPYDPEDFTNILNSLKHEYNMDRLTKDEYANKLAEVLEEYQYDLEQKDTWAIEEQIHNLRKPTSSGRINNEDLPKGLLAMMNTLEHEFKMEKINSDEYSAKLQAALGKYRKQLNQATIWNIEEKIFSLRKSSKTNEMNIDYNAFKESINTLTHELNLLDKQQQLLESTGQNQAQIFSIIKRKIENYTVVQQELNSTSQQYSQLLDDIDSRINQLDPSTTNYDKTVEKLLSDKRKLTDEIRSNSLAILEYQFAIEKAKAQIEDYISHTLNRSYELIRELAYTDLEAKHDKQIQRLEKESKKALDVINDRIRAKEKEIELLDEQIKQQEYLNTIAEINEEIEDVKADTRFAYIDEVTGKEVYTYDRAKVKELEKRLAEEELKEQQNQNKKKLEEDLEVLKDKYNQKSRHYDNELNDLRYHHEKEMKYFNDFWEEKLESEKIKQETMRLIEKEGYTNALLIAETFFGDMAREYDGYTQVSYEKGKSITDALGEGLFESLDSILNDYSKKLLGVSRGISSSRGGSGSSSSNRNNRWSDKQDEAHKSANDSRDKLEDWGYGQGSKDISSHDYKGAKEWYDKYVKDRENLSDNVKDEFKNIVDQKKKWESEYHTGGFVGGKALNPRHEEIAKMLKGELVLTPQTLDRLSFTLPRMTYSTVSNPQSPSTQPETIRPIAIYIQNLTPSDFDNFMRSIEPYVSSHK